SLAAGVNNQHTRAPDDSKVDAWLPVGAAGITHNLGSRRTHGTLQLTVSYAPTVNTVLGKLQNRVLATGSASVERGPARLTAALAFAESLPVDDPDESRYASAGLLGRYAVSSWLAVTLGS